MASGIHKSGRTRMPCLLDHYRFRRATSKRTHQGQALRADANYKDSSLDAIVKRDP